MEVLGSLTVGWLTVLERLGVLVGACLFTGVVVALCYERHWRAAIRARV